MKATSIWGAAGAAAGALFLFAALAFAQSAPSLKAGIDVSPQINPGARNTVALINFDASQSSSTIRVPSLTVSGTFSGGAGLNTLRSCSIAPISSITTPLNSGVNAVAALGNTNTFAFDTALIVPAGGMSHLALLCDVDPSATLGSSVALSISPGSIAATDQASSAPVVPTARIGGNGLAQTGGTAVIAAASAGNTTTPGVPNTGAGGWSTANIILLILAAVILIGGGALLIPKPRA